MRKFICMIFISLTLFLAAGNVSAENSISITINGYNQVYDQQPIIENGRVLVPLRGVFESLGAEVFWNNQTQEITGQKDSIYICLKVNSNKVKINNQEKIIETPAKLINGRTFVPIRFISESLGADVTWNDKANIVTIISIKQPTKEDIEKAQYYNRQASDAIKNENFTEAKNHIDLAIQYDPTNYMYFFTKGEINEKLGNIDQALTDFKKSIDFNSNFDNTYLKVATIYENKKDISNSINFISKAIDINPNNGFSLSKRANLYYKIGEYEKAIDDINNAISLNPEENSFKEQLEVLKRLFITDEQIQYFNDILFGGLSNSKVKKWTEDISIKVIGSPTKEDMVALNSTVNDINSITQNIHLSIAESSESNLKIYFIKPDDFKEYGTFVNENEKSHREIWHQEGNVINKFGNTLNRGIILISSEDVKQDERTFLIRKELTQSLGFINSPKKYQDSIFNTDNNSLYQYSDLDKKVIEILYYKEIEPGMNKQDILNLFE